MTASHRVDREYPGDADIADDITSLSSVPQVLGAGRVCLIRYSQLLI